MITEEERILSTLPQAEADQLRKFTLECRKTISDLEHTARMARARKFNDGTPWPEDWK